MVYRVAAPRPDEDAAPLPAPSRRRAVIAGAALALTSITFVAIATRSNANTEAFVTVPTASSTPVVAPPKCAVGKTALYGAMSGSALSTCVAPTSRSFDPRAKWTFDAVWNGGLVMAGGSDGPSGHRGPGLIERDAAFHCAADVEVDPWGEVATLRDLAFLGRCADAEPIDGELRGCTGPTCASRGRLLTGTIDGVEIVATLGVGGIGGDGVHLVVDQANAAVPGLLYVPESKDGAVLVLPSTSPSSVGEVYCAGVASHERRWDDTIVTLSKLARVGSCDRATAHVDGEITYARH
jgi:hypothetical protein